jgi:glutathione S-transferase
MKLIGANASPFVRKVRIVLAEKKIDYQYVLEDVWASQSTISSLNPLGKVPTLIMEDGGAVFDSRVIVEYLDTLTPLHRLIPQASRERVEVKVWEALADGLMEAAILVRLENTQRSEDKRNAAWIGRQMAKVERSLAAMSEGLAGKEWCSGGKYSLADVAVGSALGYLDFRFAALDWRTPNQGLATLYAKLALRPSFVSTVPS